MKDRFYIAEIKVNAMSARVLLNGWPIARHAEQDHKFVGTKLNPWIVAGENTLDVELAPLAQGEPDPEASFFMQVFTIEEGAELEDGNILLVYRWTPIENPLPGRGEPSPKRVFSHKWRIGTAFGPYGWETAKPFVPGDRDAVLQLLDEMNKAFASKDLDAILGLLRHKHEEIARAIGSTVDKVEDQTRKLWGEYYFGASDNAFELAPYDPDDIRMIPWSNGRLVELEHVEWPHPIIGRSDYRFSFDLTVSNVNDEWRIVR